MCQYCNYGDDGWDRLLDYDDVYRSNEAHGEDEDEHDADSAVAATEDSHDIDTDAD